MERKPRKKYFYLDPTIEDCAFALLDNVDSEDESYLSDVMNDSDTEFIAEEGLEIDTTSASNKPLVPEANVHIETPEKPVKRKANEKAKIINWSSTNNKQNNREQCELVREVQHQFDGELTPFKIFNKVCDLDNLLKIITEQSNLYAAQNGRVYATNYEEMKAFLGINFMMAINKLPQINYYWDADSYVANDGIKSTMARTQFREMLRNLHFADNSKDDKTDKVGKDIFVL